MYDIQIGITDHVQHTHVCSIEIVTSWKEKDGMQGQPMGGFEFAKAALPDRKNQLPESSEPIKGRDRDGRYPG